MNFQYKKLHHKETTEEITEVTNALQHVTKDDELCINDYDIEVKAHLS